MDDSLQLRAAMLLRDVLIYPGRIQGTSGCLTFEAREVILLSMPESTDKNPFADQNPYALPTVPVGIPDTAESALSRAVKDFRAQALALGVAWAILGCCGIALAVFAFAMGATAGFTDATGPIMFGSVALLSLAWIVVGVGSSLKKLWAIRTGLAMSYVVLAGCAITLNVCGIVIVLLIVVQAHRVLGFANKLRAAGVQLNSQNRPRS